MSTHLQPPNIAPSVSSGSTQVPPSTPTGNQSQTTVSSSPQRLTRLRTGHRSASRWNPPNWRWPKSSAANGPGNTNAATSCVADESISVPRDRQVTLIVEEVFKAALAHKSTTVPIGSYAIEAELPEFDALGDYQYNGNNVDDPEGLIREHVERLVDAANNPYSEIRFEADAAWKTVSQDTYAKFSTLSRLLCVALDICSVDNELITHEYCPGLASYRRLYFLRRRIDGLHLTTEDEENRSTQQDVQAMKALLDYFTAVLVRFIAQSAFGSYWHNNVIGALAKWTAKMTVLLDDIYNSSLIAKSAADILLDDKYVAYKIKEEEKADREGTSMATLLDLNSNNISDATSLHCANQLKFRVGIMKIMKYVLQSGIYAKSAGLSMTSFDICSATFETGFEGFKVLLFQDREYEFTGTSDLSHLNLAHSAFDILHTILDQVRARTSSRPPTGTANSTTGGSAARVETTIQWNYCKENGIPPPKSKQRSGMTNGHELRIFTMEDIITVMVPFAMTAPIPAKIMHGFIDMVSLTGEMTDEVRPYAESKFDAYFRIYTSEFSLPSYKGSDAFTLPEGITSGVFSRQSLMSNTRSRVNTSGARVSVASRGTKYQEDDMVEKMGAWVYDQSSVIVECRRYVALTMAVALVLALGGLAIGFTVKNRLRGVDPFNITTYCWVLAAFVVLIAKAFRVEKWPWSDFLHSKVHCRSVSELSAVTGVGEQLIISKLLHDEQAGSGTILNTSGPYNSVFMRKSEDGTGFTIDVPLNTRTLLLSGLIMLKVETPLGFSLVCLDARPGTDGSAVTHHMARSKEKMEKLCSTNIHRLSPNRRDHILTLPLKNESIEWRRVLGIYGNMDAAFV